MELSDKEFCDSVHLSIHSVRLLSNYKPTEFERRISKLVLEKYSETCRECKEVREVIAKQPPKESFLKRIGGAIYNA